MRIRWLALALLALALALTTPASAQIAAGTTRSRAASTLAVTALSGANAAVTATLPAVAANFHYISSIQVTRTCTTAIAGTAVLAITTTNLPGSLAWTAGNACAVGSTLNDVNTAVDAAPLKSSVVNTNTTIVCPAIGATGVCRIVVLYYVGP